MNKSNIQQSKKAIKLVTIIFAATISTAISSNSVLANTRYEASTGSTYLGLNSNTNGTAKHNTAVGAYNLTNAIRESVGGNTSVGAYSLLKLNDGQYNSSLGTSSLQNLEKGSRNTAVGQGNLYQTFEGMENTTIGFQNLLNTRKAYNNIAVGSYITQNTAEAQGNIFIGNRIGGNTTAKLSNNILIGSGLILETTAAVKDTLNIGNLIKGVLAGTKSVTVDGSFAANSISTAGDLTVTGTGAITTPALNVNGLGSFQSVTSSGVISTSKEVVANGLVSNLGATIKEGNLFVSKGYGDFFGGVTTKATVQADKALFLKQRGTTDLIPTIPSGYAGLSVHSAGKLMYHSPITGEVAAPVMITERASINDLSDVKTIQAYNSAGPVGTSIYVGLNSGAAAADGVGSYNTALGDSALGGTHPGAANTAIGFNVLKNTSTAAVFNTAVGNNAAYSLTSGQYNTVLGNHAGYGLTTGKNNILIGSQAGMYEILLSTGSDNILIGTNLSTQFPGSTKELNIGNLIKGNMTTGNKSVTIDGDLAIKGRPQFFNAGKTTLGYVLTAKGDNGQVYWAPATVAVNSVDSQKILDGSIGTFDIADSSVTGAKITNGTITNLDLAPSSVSSPNIVDGTVNGSDLAASSVRDVHIVNVSASKITGVISPTQIPVNLDVHTVQTLGVGLTTPQRPLHIKDVMRLEPRSSAPTNPSLGDIFMHTTGALCVYNGQKWDQMNAGLENSRCTDSSVVPNMLWQIQQSMYGNDSTNEPQPHKNPSLSRG